MGHLKTLAIALVALSPLAAHAGSYDGNYTPSKCAGVYVGPLLNDVETALNAAWYQNPTKDKLNLLSKLSTANSKTLVQPVPKWDDANAKLEDLSSTATALESAAKPKLIEPAGATKTIQGTVLAAQACIY